MWYTIKKLYLKKKEEEEKTLFKHTWTFTLWHDYLDVFSVLIENLYFTKREDNFSVDGKENIQAVKFAIKTNIK